MFGYVAPLKCELKVRELALYNSYYCGLCKTIGRRYGEACKLVLNYDCTFLALLLCGIEGAVPCRQERCFYKPFLKKKPVAASSKMLEFASDINILLAYFKADDDWRDEHKLKGLAIKVILKGALSKAMKNSGDAYDAIRSGIALLSDLERSGCKEPDKPAEAFADMMRKILSLSPVKNDSDRAVLGHMGYHLGRWIYLIDAWDDRTADKKRGSYNPFNVINADKERASFILHFSVNEAVKAYDLLEIKDNKGVLDNIIYMGCSQKTEQLLEGDKG
ncbi:MAG: hypothetical protein BWY11_00511 [Firmicutes bacterium ADurb.Bin182]|nr:MAG: hypothetical protein BWY11_00511 [Firmicutes bacterium ADurb.Bin182]